MTRRSFVAAGLGAFATSDSYSFWVFGLLHPTRLNLYAQGTARLPVESTDGTRILEGPEPMSVDAALAPLNVGGPVGFVLEIPGVIRRPYFGRLRISATGSLLRPVVSMSREVAVGSIVGAEMPAQGTPLQALATQAVATRSFLVAGAGHARHGDAQFCDTTHCQFLRAPAEGGSVVDKAVRATRGMLLSAGRRVIAAHYSTACGGRTESAELDHYQYRAVFCETCRTAGVARKGPGLGLCQTGAIGLARAGWSYRRILEKYYAGCVIRND